jgi:hypothetical protein
LNIIENSIINSSPIFKNYLGRKYIKNGVGILKEEKLLNYMVKEEYREYNLKSIKESKIFEAGEQRYKRLEEEL